MQANRRRLLTTSVGALGAVGATTTGARAARSPVLGQAPGQTRRRITLPSGVQSGDVTTHQAVLWARASGEGRLVARVADDRGVRTIRGPLATSATDFTARLDLAGLASGREYDATLWFESPAGVHGEAQHLTFRTADRYGAATSFVWSGNTCGQGWGINPDLGGLTAYDAMRRTEPDFFVHCGRSVYSDSPIAETVTEPDGQVWRNLVVPEVVKVAESMAEFRGRHRYNLMDDNVRRMAAEVPIIAQWDDHETHHGWWPGRVLDDSRYTEQRVDVLAARARRAWQEYQPISTAAVHGRGRDGFAAARIYRKIDRGRHLDLFCLDMRIPDGSQDQDAEPTPILGAAQTAWLIREVVRSPATWKVISGDLPLGLVGPAGRESEIAQALKAFRDHGVRNVVWITADVHYCAAHHYRPERATFTDFEPFWEIVAGPIAAGTFGPRELHPTFGPEVVFGKYADYPNQSPRHGNQFFGHAAIDNDGELTLSLRNAVGSVLWSKQLAPD
ncbi:alkaline phosphatase D family protein [Nocardioides speluncae]|uniref:alkaline phosphatase D family protein n=1 Tax=Nocardioides speluncae TaxID=2670337 RepID=UPI000D68928C|nr:alkaline phosphatase D family protein [Nocardioides speluncae]